MDVHNNKRPLLQQSSDDEDEPAEFIIGGKFASAVSGTEHRSSTSFVLTRRKMDNDFADTCDADDDEDINTHLKKELLRNENAPKDRFNFNYIAFYLLGMTTQLPWNFFFTAQDYWMYKFRDVTTNSTSDDLTPIQTSFTSDLSVASTIPNTLFLILNAFVGHRIPLRLRMVGSLMFVFICFIVTTVLVGVNTDLWQNTFFQFTLASVVVMNIASAILSGGLFGICGQFPSKCITAVVSGQVLGGIFAALAEIVSLTFGASPTTSALVYFMIGNFVLLISLVSYLVMSRTDYFKYFTAENFASIKASQQLISNRSTLEPNFYDVLRKIWLYGFSEWLVFVVTLSVYPSVTVLISSQEHGNGHPWNDIYFVTVVNYLIFNIGDYLGRIIAGMIEWPRNKPILVALLNVARIVFVPAFILCNAKPRHVFSTLIHSDSVFIILMGLFSLSNGYLSNIPLIWAPNNSRLLLQQSSDDDDDSADFIIGGPSVDKSIAPDASRTEDLSRRLMVNDFEDAGAADDDVNTDPTQELLRNENAPQDRFNFIYFAFYLLSMTTQLPWNFFFTPQDYWMFKFRDVTTNSTSDDLTPIQASFTSELSVASTVPNTLFLILNAVVGYRIPLRLRMVGSLMVVLICFIVTTVLVEVNTDPWQTIFLQFTLASVVVMNAASGILSGGLFGICGQFPSMYITAVVSGQVLGGIFAALAEILMLTFGTSPTTSALIYFMIGIFVLLISWISYLVMLRTDYFKYYTAENFTLIKASQQSISNLAILEPNFYDVLRKIWLYGFSEWLVFVVTLSVYPSVTVLISSQEHGNGHLWNDIYFVTVVNYLIFNIGDYLGRIIAGMIEWPRNKPILVAFLNVSRIVFVPAIILCNAKPRHVFPTLIHSDYIFIILMSLFSLTNGYLSNIPLIWAPKTVHNHEREMASSMMAAFQGIGLAFGSSISLILVKFL